ncbi:DUF4240 domain-containing protein [Dactylosporangium sp. NPDC005572]|uniref:DUF4240 domain-containing protein n=1 Tax=Dactylosporangium sp. NPDC005572 TaxID=3156889 RepID=UPI0033A6FD3C
MPTSTGAVWDLLDRVPAANHAGKVGMDELVSELARLPVPRIVEFHRGVVALANRALTWRLWEAATIIFRQEIGQDSFTDFRLWLVAQGREVFEAAVADPDSLAGHRPIRALAAKPASTWTDEDFPTMWELVGVGALAFDLVLRKLNPRMAKQVEFPEALERGPRESPDGPDLPRFGEEPETSRRCPRLVQLFA